MEYRDAVTRGRTLLSRSEADQWALAELTYQVLVVDKVTTRTWAADLGVSHTHVRRLRDVWATYAGGNPGFQRSNRTFAECYALTKVPAENGEGEAREPRGGSSPTGGRPHAAWMKNAREILNDRKARRELLRDPEVRAILERELRGGRDPEPEPKPTPEPRGREPEPKPGPAPRRRTPREDFVTQLNELRDRVNEVLGEMIDVRLSDRARQRISEALDELENSLGWMRTYVDSGDRSFEDALETILDEGTIVEIPERTPDPKEPPPAPRPRPKPVDETPEPGPDPEPAPVPPEPPRAERPRRPRGHERKDPLSRPRGRGHKGS